MRNKSEGSGTGWKVTSLADPRQTLLAARLLFIYFRTCATFSNSKPIAKQQEMQTGKTVTFFAQTGAELRSKTDESEDL